METSVENSGAKNPLQIVVLDALPLDAEGDMDWEPLRELGNLTLYAQTEDDEVDKRIATANVVYTNKVRLRDRHFAVAPHLKLVSVLATGYDIVDTASARRQGTTVCNVPGYSTPSTAQTTIALLLALCHQVERHAESVRAGAWTNSQSWSWWQKTPVELEGKTLLILGYGAVGKRVAQIAAALGMSVITAQLPGRSEVASTTDDIPRLPLTQALVSADVISLHCPLTPDTKELINAERIALLKPGTLLVNTARGGLIEETAVVASLESGQLGGYAADVLAGEPPQQEHPLLFAPNCIITAHYAWASKASRTRLLEASIENLRHFLAGTPQNVVS